MAKILQTRIKNRFDTLANWEKAGVELLKGEIALVSVTTQQFDEATGNVVNVPAVLMKVGEEDADGNPKAFKDLPWLSAAAADVYSWAKGEHAEDIKVKVVTSTTGGVTTYNEGLGDITLSNWLKKLYDKDNEQAGTLASHKQILDKLTGGENETESVASQIKAAIEALDVNTTSGEGTFVKAVTQTDGKIAVTMGKISNAELPDDISASKILTGDSNYGTLDTMLGNINSQLANVKSTVLDSLDLTHAQAQADSTATTTKVKFVTQVTQTDGQVAVYNREIQLADIPNIPTEKIIDGNVTTAKIADSNVTTAKIADSNVTTAKIANAAVTDAKIDTVSASKVIVDASASTNLVTKLGSIDSEISDIKAAIEGGTHFRGVVATAPTGTTYTLKDETTAKTAGAGDIVLCGEKEYIYVGNGKWEELGDLTRAGVLETWRAGLDYTARVDGDATEFKYVTSVTQEDGKIAVTYARPDAGDITYNISSTVSATLATHDTEVAKLSDIAEGAKVGATIDSKITTALDALDLNAPTATDDANNPIAFIDTVSQENGQLSATKKTIRSATTSVSGIVQLNDTTTSTSTTQAATANAVKTVQDDLDGAKARLSAVEGDYMRIGSDNKLYYGKASTSGDVADTVIIFDCGGAELN